MKGLTLMAEDSPWGSGGKLGRERETGRPSSLSIERKKRDDRMRNAGDPRSGSAQDDRMRRRESRHSTRFSRSRGTVQQGPVQRQETQIVQSCK